VLVFQRDAEAPAHGVERAQAFGHDFTADAVSGNDSDSICLRHASLLFGFSMTTSVFLVDRHKIWLLVKPLCTNREESAEPKPLGERDFARCPLKAGASRMVL
jgi:hypothetical protein